MRGRAAILQPGCYRTANQPATGAANDRGMSGQHNPGPAKILLVEDDPDTGRYIVDVLTRRAGLEVRHANSPAEALSLTGRGHRFDLVISDIEMPGMSGIELLGRIRETAPGVPVMIITAHATVGNAVGAVRGKADEFLQKPLRPDDLIGAVSGHAGAQPGQPGAGARGGRAPGRRRDRHGRDAAGASRSRARGVHPDDVPGRARRRGRRQGGRI